jgi:hypothetical protein
VSEFEGEPAVIRGLSATSTRVVEGADRDRTTRCCSRCSDWKVSGRGVSEITIYKQAQKGNIPSCRVGTCVRFCPKSVADWIARR